MGIHLHVIDWSNAVFKSIINEQLVTYTGCVLIDIQISTEL